MQNPSLLNSDDVLVLINTCEKYKKKATAISKTWGKRLKSFHYITDYDTNDLPNVVNLKVSEYDQLTLKCFHMWKFVHEKYGTSKKWILKIDDDCYLWIENMLTALSCYDHRQSWYFGNRLHCSQNKEKDGKDLNWVPGPAYFLSQKCFEELIKILSTESGANAYLCHKAEDISLGQTLSSNTIFPVHLPGVFAARKIKALHSMPTPIAMTGMTPSLLRVFDLFWSSNNKMIIKMGLFLYRFHRKIFLFLEKRNPSLAKHYLKFLNQRMGF